MNKNLFTAIVFGIILTGCHNMKSEINKVIHRKTIYESDQFSVYGDSVVQGSFTAKAISRNEIVSNYISPGAKKSPVVQFKFSINGADNSAPAGKDNVIVCMGDSTVYSMPAIKFGQQYVDSTKFSPNDFLKKDVKVKLRVDMTDILKSFKEKGYYQTFDGKK
ncbi:MAG TPA: hypothetical protein VFD44_03350, partial [Hanamia sp.]|nr:hypothetical protein [Hanamia sp.]